MSTATKTFSKKGIWHSDLVRHGRMLVQITSEPRESQFKGKPAYCYFQVAGDPTEYAYNVENDTIGDLLSKAPKHVWVMMHASGREDDATLELTEAEGHPVYDDHGNSREPLPERAPQDGPPPMWPDDPPQEQTTPVPRATKVGRAVADTLEAVRALEKGGVRVDSDAAARIFNTIYIQHHRS